MKSNSYTIHKGYNLDLNGKPQQIIEKIKTDKIIIHPASIHGIKAKLLIKENDKVKIGTPLFFDKKNPDVMFVSSGSGVVSKITFGARRIIESIIIDLDGKNNHDDVFANISIESLCKSGLLSYIRQRPFSKVANPNVLPKSIFISAMPTAPYSIDYEFLFNDNNLRKDTGYKINETYNIFIQKGIDVLSEVTNSTIHFITCSEKESNFKKLSNVVHSSFNNLHPAGNVGIQIHSIDPIKDKNDVVWYLSLQDLYRIGCYFIKEEYPVDKYYSISGKYLKNPKYIIANIGTPISSLLSDEDSLDEQRIISGDVLSGSITNTNNSLNYYDDVISVIKENHNRDFLGWLSPGIDKFTLSGVFASSFLGNRESEIDTKVNGSIRTIIPMGNWAKFLPMNIMPEFLIKSILSKDIELMEKLGIYESSPEDYALCTVACQSKVEVSKIIQQGLDLIEIEG